MHNVPAADITKIELVDGSDVLFSLSGELAQALNIYDRRCPSMNGIERLMYCEQRSAYGIDFGRFLHDPLLAFDPAKFSNPQLKVSYDVDVSDTAADEGELEVFAECFDEKVVSPIGFLMSKEVESLTLSSVAAYHYTDLPTDFPVRKMLLRGYTAGKEPWYQVIEAKLSEDNDKRIPFDWDLQDYFYLMQGIWRPVVESLVGYCHSVGEYVFYVTPTNYFVECIPVQAGGAPDYGVCVDSWQRGGQLAIHAQANSSFQAHIMGWLPNHCFEFPFGDPQDIDDWYDVTKVGSLQLRTREGGGGAGTQNVVLQQLRKY